MSRFTIISIESHVIERQRHLRIGRRAAPHPPQKSNGLPACDEAIRIEEIVVGTRGNFSLSHPVHSRGIPMLPYVGKVRRSHRCRIPLVSPEKGRHMPTKQGLVRAKDIAAVASGDSSLDRPCHCLDVVRVRCDIGETLV